jgi:hypothetical protein
MDLPSKTIIDVLTYLLPGFITAALLYRLTPAPRPIPFERVIQALIFTIVIQLLVTGTKHVLFKLGDWMIVLGPWTNDVALAWSVVIAFVLGLFAVWTGNSDTIHRRLRRMRITHQTSFPSEWYGVFCKHEGYVVLHLKGERRLLGWPEEWPNAPGVGHFVVEKAAWLSDTNELIELAGVERVLVKADEIEMVELMRPVTEAVRQEEQHGRSQGADSGTSGTPDKPSDGGNAGDNERHDEHATGPVQTGASTSTTPTKEVAPSGGKGRMQWVSIELKGTKQWRIALVEEGWSEGDFSDPPRPGEIFATKAEADAECERRNYPTPPDDPD